MRLEKASHKAIKYACLNFHYAKALPVNTFGYSVFNDKDEWCGVILYALGANNNLAKSFNLQQGQVLELVRVALNGKQEATSKAISISLKIIKRDCPNVKVIVSYADMGQNHIGVVYQATNWIFIESQSSSGIEVFSNGKWMHKRSYDGLKIKTKIIETRKKAGKYKYVYPLEKSLINLCKSLSKPYPKKQAVIA
jgi:hypothetical protein